MPIKRVPEPRRNARIGFFGLLVCSAAAVSMFQMILSFPGSRQQSQQSSSSLDATRVAKIDRSAAMQANRKKLIQILMEKQVFQKAEVSGSLPRLWVGTSFYALGFDLKQIYVSVYAQYVEGDNIADTVHLYDGKTGNEIGRYSASDGGLKIF